MAGCKRCALKGGEKGKEKRREKKHEKKGGKMGIKIVFFFFFFFFISPRAGFSICPVVTFQIYKENCIIRYCLRSKF